jgi:folate-binding protein YgfZ
MGTAEQATPSHYCRLHRTSLLAFNGEDAGKFLQGQSTCDILALQDGHSTIGAFCTAKGRVIAVFHVLRHGDGFFLAVNSTLAECLRQHLSRYVLRAKVSISDVSSDYALFSVMGNTHPASSIDATGIVIPFSAHTPALSLHATPVAQADNLVTQFEQLSLTLADEALWSREHVRHGIPDIDETTSEAFIPQMLNLDLLDGIGFKKGCYTGQEIIARTHYLGQSKRRMFRLTVSGLPPFKTGDAIMRGNDSVGTVVTATAMDVNSRQQELLAVVNLDDIDDLPAGFTRQTLPYSVS